MFVFLCGSGYEQVLLNSALFKNVLPLTHIIHTAYLTNAHMFVSLLTYTLTFTFTLCF